MVVETMNAIMTKQGAVEKHLDDPWRRDHFESPALQNVDKLSTSRPQDFMSVEDLAKVGMRAQLDKVMRWKPRKVSPLPPMLRPGGWGGAFFSNLCAHMKSSSLIT